MFTWRQNSPRLLQLIEQLETLGYFRYVEPGKLSGVKSSFMRKPSLSSLQANREFGFPSWRVGPDARTCQLANFIRSLFPIFKDIGIHIKEMEEHNSSEGHWIVIDGQRFELALPQRVRASAAGQSLEEYKTPRSFAVINKLFEDAQSEERIYYSKLEYYDHRGHVMPTAAYDLLMQYKIEGANDLVLYDADELV